MTLLSSVTAVPEMEFDAVADADLTAVERFSARQANELVPRQARYYRDLVPLALPQPGEQYAFGVDLDACTGCKACVAACHSLNGLDDDESWRSVTLLTGGTSARPVQQLVTSACHHCAEPACLAGCPADAYEKDPVTGIVAHLDDQCIGCGYCTLTCPYEVPVFNHQRGIVRKCDMCQDRLSAGEAPACVQACPNEAISITVISTSARRPPDALAPPGPPPAITGPTTVYRTSSADIHALAAKPIASPGPAKAHTPLAVMLVLTQLAVGAFAADVVIRARTANPGGAPPRVLDATVALSAAVLAIGASVLHLGRPRYFYRAAIGWRHSWLSREVIAFGAFTTLAGAYAASVALRIPARGPWQTALGWTALGAGLIGVACSVLIYTTTHRASWRPAAVSAKFTFTAVACGLSAVTWASLLAGTAIAQAQHLLLASIMAAKLLGEITMARRPLVEGLRRMTNTRLAAGAVGGLAVPIGLAAVAATPSPASVALASLGLAALVTGELAERSLFFTTASPPQ